MIKDFGWDMLEMRGRHFRLTLMYKLTHCLVDIDSRNPNRNPNPNPNPEWDCARILILYGSSETDNFGWKSNSIDIGVNLVEYCQIFDCAVFLQ